VRVFLSYQTRDAEQAKRLADALSARRPDIVIFLAPRTLAAGAYWLPRLADELKQSDAVLFLVGQHVGSWQELEYYESQRLARKTGRPLIVPIIMVDQSPGLPFFDLLHHIFAPDPVQRDVLVAALAALEGSGGARRSPAWSRFNPYKGLPAFTSADAAFFFGRDGLVGHILETLGDKPNNIVALIGASGVGKSSLAQAGVLAALKSQSWPGDHNHAWPVALADSREWLSLTIHPGETPLKEFALAFLRIFIEDTARQEREANGWAENLRSGSSLDALLKTVTYETSKLSNGPPPAAFLIYVDQGEDLYSRSDARESARFSELLRKAARRPDCRVIGSFRADYYGRLQADSNLFPSTIRIDVPPLDPDALEAVIRRPATMLGVRFDSIEMSEQVVAATARESGALPLLSFLLSDMWQSMQSRGDGVLRWADRRELFDVSAPLRERAENYYARNPVRQSAIRRLFTLKLASVLRHGEAVRRRAAREECTSDEWHVAEELSRADRRLVTLSDAGRMRDAIAEVAHEQLLRKWPRLVAWIQEQREFLVWKTGLEVDRNDWLEARDADKSSFLLSGRQLAVARQWFDSSSEDLSGDDRLFIAASIEFDESQRKLAAEEREELEKHRRLEAEKRAARIWRAFIWVVTLIGAVAAGAALVSVWQVYDTAVLFAEAEPVSSAISVDGTELGAHINNLRLASGTHDLQVWAPNHFAARRRIEIPRRHKLATRFWLEEGFEREPYTSPAIQGGHILIPGPDDTILVHNEFDRIVFLSTATGRIVSSVDTPAGNIRAFLEFDLGGDVGRVIVSGFDAERSGPDVLVLRAKSPAEELWRWQGPASGLEKSDGVAVVAVPQPAGPAAIAVAGRDGHVYLLDGRTGAQIADTMISPTPLPFAPQLVVTEYEGAANLAVFYRQAGASPDNPKPLHGALVAMSGQRTLWQRNYGSSWDGPTAGLRFAGHHHAVVWNSSRWQAIDLSSQRCVELFAPSSRVSALTNVPTISRIQGMFPYDRNPL
jgi:hypothetical protein